MSSIRNRCWKDASNVAQLSKAVVQSASMLAQPSSMLAQLRIWIGCGSDLIFERRPEASSKARFSQAADQGPTRGRPGANQGPESPQTRGQHPWPLVLKGRPLVFKVWPLGRPLVFRVRPLGRPLVFRFGPWFGPWFLRSGPWFGPWTLVSRPSAPGLELQIQGPDH